MEIRAYERGDLDALLRLFYDTVHAVNLGDYTQAQVDAWADGCPDRAAWERSLAEHVSLVALAGEKIIGFGDIDESGYLDRLYVHKDFQQRGVATALCDRLEAHARGKTVTAHASITALPFFLRRGYRLVRPQTVFRKSVALNNFLVEKPPFLSAGSPAMRRAERMEARREEVFAVIARCKVLRLALNVPGGAPYIVPMNFGWEAADDMPVFYLHCAGEGRKLDLLRLDARVGFEMDGAHASRTAMFPARTAISTRASSVRGAWSLSTAREEKARALERIMAQQTGEALPVSPAQARCVTVLRLRTEEFHCKKNAPARAQKEARDERYHAGRRRHPGKDIGGALAPHSPLWALRGAGGDALWRDLRGHRSARH